jgi:hypothetical protein
MKKSYKYALIVIATCFLIFALLKVYERLHVNLLDKFTEKYFYYPLDESVEIEQTYYGEYLDSFERMWYQYEELHFITDTTFQIVTNSAYFQDYLFPVKYYLGLLDFSKWESGAQDTFVLKSSNVYESNSDSLRGTLIRAKDYIIFKYDRP